MLESVYLENIVMIVYKVFTLANDKHTIFNTKYYLVNPTPRYICYIRQTYLDIVIQYLVSSNTVLTALIKLQIGQYIKKNFISNVSQLYPFGNFVMCYEFKKMCFHARISHSTLLMLLHYLLFPFQVTAASKLG